MLLLVPTDKGLRVTGGPRVRELDFHGRSSSVELHRELAGEKIYLAQFVFLHYCQMTIHIRLEAGLLKF